MKKGGVDTCDKMCASYSISRVTRQWPLAVFYILMNIAGINSWVIYTIWWTATQNAFLEKPIVESNERASLLKISNTFTVSAFLEKYHPLPVEDHGDGIAGRPPKKRGSCFICGRQKNSSASMKCNQCNRFICKQHSKKQIICANYGDVNVITSSECD